MALQGFYSAVRDLSVVETRAFDAAKERGLEFGTKGYWAVKREFGVDAAYDRERRTGDENCEAFARLLNTPRSRS